MDLQIGVTKKIKTQNKIHVKMTRVAVGSFTGTVCTSNVSTTTITVGDFTIVLTSFMMLS